MPSLRAVAAHSQLRGVVTQPDRPAGRGHKLTPSPVKAAAMELGVPVYEPQRLRAFAGEIQGERFDLFALASYGRILPQQLLNLPRLGALNVHPSLLPKQTLECPYIDIVVRGQGEDALLEVVRHLEARAPMDLIPGIGFKRDGKLHFTTERPLKPLIEMPVSHLWALG